VSNFKRLEVWEAGRRLTIALYRDTAAFPKSEGYGLTSQIRRAATSICANIAEGCGRRSDSELRTFLMIARGSAHELESHLLIARDLGMLNKETWAEANAELQRIGTMLLRLARAQR